jgi:periplasmic protein CpxP/Spy
MKIIIFTLSLLLTCSTFAAGDQSKFERGEFLKNELGLSDEQLEKVKEIRKSGRDEMKADRSEFKKLKNDFHAAMKNSNASKEELTTKFEAFQKARDEFQRNRFQMMLKMREILSPEQLEKFRAMKKENRGKRKENAKNR